MDLFALQRTDHLHDFQIVHECGLKRMLVVLMLALALSKTGSNIVIVALDIDNRAARRRHGELYI